MINIYLDTTGSMTELGKDSALVYIAKSIQDYCDFKKIQTSFYELDGTKIEKLNSISFSNSNPLNIEKIQPHNILVSDGLFDTNENNLFDVSIALGADANQSQLKRISKKIYDVENTISAIEYMIVYYDLLSSEKKESDDEDEW